MPVSPAWEKDHGLGGRGPIEAHENLGKQIPEQRLLSLVPLALLLLPPQPCGPRSHGDPPTADCSWEHEPASPEVGQNCASAWNGVVWGSDLGSAEASTGLFPCRMEGDGTLETQGFTSTEMKLRHHLLSMLGAGASGNPVPMVPQELYFHRRKAGTQRTSH